MITVFANNLGLQAFGPWRSGNPRPGGLRRERTPSRLFAVVRAGGFSGNSGHAQTRTNANNCGTFRKPPNDRRMVSAVHAGRPQCSCFMNLIASIWRRLSNSDTKRTPDTLNTNKSLRGGSGGELADAKISEGDANYRFLRGPFPFLLSGSERTSAFYATEATFSRSGDRPQGPLYTNILQVFIRGSERKKPW